MKIVIIGEPVAQGRPRFARQGAFIRTYDPEASRSWKQTARLIAIEQMREQSPLCGAIELRISIHRKIPQSWSRKKQERALSGFLRPTSRPDTDNYIKSVQDALNGIVWKDDSQVVALIADKWYSDKPRIEIDVREVEE
jgi:Holliday junction resolvase RusA-like endonuclease